VFFAQDRDAVDAAAVTVGNNNSKETIKKEVVT